MRKILAAFAVMTLAAGAFAQVDTFRFFFDVAGADEASASPGPSDNTNPSVLGGKLYVYLMYGDASQVFNSVDLDLDLVSVAGGSATVVSDIYNHVITSPSSPTGNRWNTTNDASWSAFRISEFGARASGTGGDSHYTSGGFSGANGSTLLGNFDFTYTGAPGGSVQVFMKGGSTTNARQGGSNKDNVFFGFGDASTKNKVGNRSAEADAFITPEPASLALLGLGALALRRRR